MNAVFKMNMLRKLMGPTGSGSSGSASGRRSLSGLYDGSGGGGSAQPADNSLGLMHLRKLYSELKSSTSGSSQRDLENMLYNMLPLFCKVSPLCCLSLKLVCLLISALCPLTTAQKCLCIVIEYVNLYWGTHTDCSYPHLRSALCSEH